jgi:hypothetical protein
MALIEFEKTMIHRIDAEIRQRKQRGKPLDGDDDDLRTIMEGTEAERKSLIADYVAAVGIPACNAAIAAANAEEAAAQALLADMQAYIA